MSKERDDENVVLAEPIDEVVSYKRKWAHDFFNICYTDREKSQKFCPYFLPWSFPCSCAILGCVTTKKSKQEGCLFEMVNIYNTFNLYPPHSHHTKSKYFIIIEQDPMGWLCCCLSCVSTPFTGPLFCCCHAMFYRNDVAKEYNVDQSKDIVLCECFDIFWRCFYFVVIFLHQLTDSSYPFPPLVSLKRLLLFPVLIFPAI